MHIRRSLKWVEWWGPPVSLAILVVLLIRLDRDLRSDRFSEEASPDAVRSTAVPPDRRHTGLDTSVVEGLRLMGIPGIERIDVGAFEIRKKKVGFMRVGAFNEALIHNLSVVLNELILDRVTHAQPGAYGRKAPHTGEARMYPASPLAALLDGFLGTLWQHSPYRHLTVSGFRIRGLSITLIRCDGTELHLLQSERAIPRLESNMPTITLVGGVIFQSAHGGTVRCREAVVVFSDNPTVRATQGTVTFGMDTSDFRTLSFPLTSLVHDKKSTIRQDAPMHIEPENWIDEEQTRND